MAMRLRKSIRAPNRFHDDEFPNRHKDVTKPAYPELLAQQVVPFNPNLPAVAWNSKPLNFDDSKDIGPSHTGQQVGNEKDNAENQTAQQSPSHDKNKTAAGQHDGESDSNDDDLDNEASKLVSKKNDIDDEADEITPRWNSLVLAVQHHIFNKLRERQQAGDVAIALKLTMQELSEIEHQVNLRQIHPMSVEAIWTYAATTSNLGGRIIGPERMPDFIDYLVFASHYETASDKEIENARSFLQHVGLSPSIMDSFTSSDGEVDQGQDIANTRNVSASNTDVAAVNPAFMPGGNKNISAGRQSNPRAPRISSGTIFSSSNKGNNNEIHGHVVAPYNIFQPITSSNPLYLQPIQPAINNGPGLSIPPSCNSNAVPQNTNITPPYEFVRQLAPLQYPQSAVQVDQSRLLALADAAEASANADRGYGQILSGANPPQSLVTRTLLRLNSELGSQSLQRPDDDRGLSRLSDSSAKYAANTGSDLQAWKQCFITSLKSAPGSQNKQAVLDRFAQSSNVLHRHRSGYVDSRNAQRNEPAPRQPRTQQLLPGTSQAGVNVSAAGLAATGGHPGDAHPGTVWRQTPQGQHIHQPTGDTTISVLSASASNASGSDHSSGSGSTRRKLFEVVERNGAKTIRRISDATSSESATSAAQDGPTPANSVADNVTDTTIQGRPFLQSLLDAASEEMIDPRLRTAPPAPPVRRLPPNPVQFPPSLQRPRKADTSALPLAHIRPLSPAHIRELESLARQAIQLPEDPAFSVVSNQPATAPAIVMQGQTPISVTVPTKKRRRTSQMQPTPAAGIGVGVGTVAGNKAGTNKKQKQKQK